MTAYLTGVIVWLCISSAVSIIFKDALIQHKWITREELERLQFTNGRAKSFIQFVAINMIPIFRGFVVAMMVIMSFVDREDLGI